MNISKSKEGLQTIINLFKKYHLTQNLVEQGIYYCLEFQTKPFSKNGETQRYFIRGYSANKVTLYNCLIEIHEEFNMNYDFIKSISIENFEEYVFKISTFFIEGKFYSLTRK